MPRASHPVIYIGEEDKKEEGGTGMEQGPSEE